MPAAVPTPSTLRKSPGHGIGVRVDHGWIPDRAPLHPRVEKGLGTHGWRRGRAQRVEKGLRRSGLGRVGDRHAPSVRWPGNGQARHRTGVHVPAEPVPTGTAGAVLGRTWSWPDPHQDDWSRTRPYQHRACTAQAQHDQHLAPLRPPTPQPRPVQAQRSGYASIRDRSSVAAELEMNSFRGATSLPISRSKTCSAASRSERLIRRRVR